MVFVNNRVCLLKSILWRQNWSRRETKASIYAGAGWPLNVQQNFSSFWRNIRISLEETKQTKSCLPVCNVEPARADCYKEDKVCDCFLIRTNASELLLIFFFEVSIETRQVFCLRQNDWTQALQNAERHPQSFWNYWWDFYALLTKTSEVLLFEEESLSRSCEIAYLSLPPSEWRKRG